MLSLSHSGLREDKFFFFICEYGFPQFPGGEYEIGAVSKYPEVFLG